MTNVIIMQNDDQIINYINIKDHANYAIEGQDIVCAAISSICYGILNTLEQLNILDENYLIDKDNANIKITFNFDEISQIIAKTMMIQLQTIQESYPDYITITIK